eukprot:3423113-Pyramimonas_sp.AAC.1
MLAIGQAIEGSIDAAPNASGMFEHGQRVITCKCHVAFILFYASVSSGTDARLGFSQVEISRCRGASLRERLVRAP